MIGSGLVTPVVGMDTLVQFWKTNNNCLTSSPPVNVPNIDLADSSTVTVFNHSNCSCNSDVKFYKINGGGHTWPGVEILSYELIAGQTNEDIQASEELWNFFKVHSLCNTSVGVNEKSMGNSFFISPNPANSIIHADCKNGFQILNSTGIIVKESMESTNQIDISDLPSGLYLLNANRFYGRFVKVH